jgi:hypothetical protein
VSNIVPISLIAVGGLIVVVGSFWLALNTMKSGNETKAANAKLLDTAQDAAARMGNDKTRDELIQARTRLLIDNRSTSDTSVKDIIGRLPALADEYNKLNQDKAHTVEAMATNFKLCWGPLIKFTLAEFDRRLDEIRKELGASGELLKVTSRDDFDLTAVNSPAPRANTIDGGDVALHPTARTVSVGNVNLYVSYSRAVITASSMTDAVIAFGIRGSGGSTASGVREDPFTLQMGLYEGSTGPGEGFPKPKDGIPPQEITVRVRAKIVTALERLLIVDRATREK